jgi:hypothetical protein
MMEAHVCDVCGEDDAADIDATRHYTGGQAASVCRNCGFVYARLRPSSEEVTKAWAEEIFAAGTFTEATYTARGIPAVRARHVYVAEFVATRIGTQGRDLVDIGAGEGEFLTLLQDPRYETKVFGIEPSGPNCELMTKAGVACFHGRIEEYLAAPGRKPGGFDLATIAWTLENTGSCSGMMEGARSLLKTGGYLTVATSSRILVPFKKPMHYFLHPRALAIHPFFFSANALTNLFTRAGFEVEHVNRFIDTDYLVMSGRALAEPAKKPLLKDDWRAVISFFDRWHAETRDYYAST